MSSGKQGSGGQVLAERWVEPWCQGGRTVCTATLTTTTTKLAGWLADNNKSQPRWNIVLPFGILSLKTAPFSCIQFLQALGFLKFQTLGSDHFRGATGVVESLINQSLKRQLPLPLSPCSSPLESLSWSQSWSRPVTRGLRTFRTRSCSRSFHVGPLLFLIRVACPRLTGSCHSSQSVRDYQSSTDVQKTAGRLQRRHTMANNMFR